MPIDASAAAMHSARGQARAACASQHLDESRCDAAELVVSELVGNAIRHGRPPVELDMRFDGDDLLVTVEDGDAELPADGTACAGFDDESGRGLFLVSVMSRAFGWHRSSRGKQVWARV